MPVPYSLSRYKIYIKPVKNVFLFLEIDILFIAMKDYVSQAHFPLINKAHYHICDQCLAENENRVQLVFLGM